MDHPSVGPTTFTAGPGPAIPIPRRTPRKPGSAGAAALRGMAPQGAAAAPAPSRTRDSSPFQKYSASQSHHIAALVARVETLRAQIDPEEFRRVFIETLKHGLNPDDLGPMLDMLHSTYGLTVAAPSPSTPKPRKRRGKKTQLKLDVPNPDEPNRLRRSPRLSPGTPVLVDALVNLTRQFPLSPPESPMTASPSASGRGFLMPTSPRLRQGGRQQRTGRRRTRAGSIDSLQLGGAVSPRRSPRLSLTIPDDGQEDNGQRSIGFPSPIPLSSPRAWGMPRVAVVRKSKKKKKGSKRKRKLTRKAAALAAAGVGVDDANTPMSPGRQYLLQNFVGPVSPLLREKPKTAPPRRRAKTRRVSRTAKK